MTVVNVDALGAVGDGVTDDTAVFNAAFAAVRSTGGWVKAGSKPYLVGSINATCLTSVRFSGEIGGVNGRKGTRLIPSFLWGPTLDLTGSCGVTVEHIQIGGDEIGKPRTKGQTGIMLAQCAANPEGSSLISLNNVHVAGEWTGCPLYVYGVGDSRIEFSRFWKYCGGIAGMFTRDNVYSFGSQYQTLATGEHGVGNWGLYDSEFHDFDPNGNPTSGAALWLRGCPKVRIRGGLLDSSTNVAGTIYASKVGTTLSSILLDGVTGYSEEPGRLPNYSFYVPTGETLDVYGMRRDASGNVLTLSNDFRHTTALVGGGGALNVVS